MILLAMFEARRAARKDALPLRRAWSTIKESPGLHPLPPLIRRERLPPNDAATLNAASAGRIGSTRAWMVTFGVHFVTLTRH